MSSLPSADQGAMDHSPPVALFLSGESFMEAAQHTHRAIRRRELKLRFETPVYYLYSHTIELTLKAFLRAKGMSSQELRGKRFKRGHSLLGLWEECLARGLVLDGAPHIAEIVTFLEPYAMSFEFRYIQTGYKTLPSLEDLCLAAQNLSAAIRPVAAPR